MNRDQAYHKLSRGWPIGFTLLEVLASLMLVGIVLPGIVGGLSLVLATAERAQRQTEATELAQAKMAELLATETPTRMFLSGDFGPERHGYNWSAQWIQWEVSMQGSTLWQLDVKVAWTSRGKERTVCLNTLIYAGSTS